MTEFCKEIVVSLQKQTLWVNIINDSDSELAALGDHPTVCSSEHFIVALLFSLKGSANLLTELSINSWQDEKTSALSLEGENQKLATVGTSE